MGPRGPPDFLISKLHISNAISWKQQANCFPVSCSQAYPTVPVYNVIVSSQPWCGIVAPQWSQWRKAGVVIPKIIHQLAFSSPRLTPPIVQLDRRRLTDMLDICKTLYWCLTAKLDNNLKYRRLKDIPEDEVKITTQSAVGLPVVLRAFDGTYIVQLVCIAVV